MKLRYTFLSILALAVAMMTSCTDRDSVAGTEADGMRTFTFNVATGDGTQTRATTAAPVVSGFDMQYILQVLNADGSNVDLGSGVTQQTNTDGRFAVKLPVGKVYTCLFWAQYVPTGTTASAFFTTTDLQAVTLKKSLESGDECQAFSAIAEIPAAPTTADIKVTLTRAVAQLNLKSNAKMENYSKVKATYTQVPDRFNVKTNEVALSGSNNTAAFEATTFTAGADGSGKFPFHSAYVLASGNGNANLLTAQLEIFNTASTVTPIQTVNINDVPVKRNFRTNVINSFDPATTKHTYVFNYEEWGADPIISKWNGVIPAADANYKFGDATKNGTSEADAYVISSAADLAQLTANVNAGTSYDGKYFKQDVDIDMDGANHEWMPIGKNENDLKPFKANYDGGGHRIIDLKVNMTGGSPQAGFFGYAEGNIVIKNIHVSGDVSSTYIAGGVCGQMSKYSDTTSGKISGCSFRGSLNGPYAGGGICGYGDNKTVITACANYGTVTSISQGGGIVGAMMRDCLVAGCYNTGAVCVGTSATNPGGIAGTSTTCIGCYNTGVIGGDTPMSITVHGVQDSYTIVQFQYSGGSSDAATEFSGSAWPAYTNSSSSWYVDVNPDGSYTANSDNTAVSNCKFWKSGGAWNDNESLREYPKLWWEK